MPQPYDYSQLVGGFQSPEQAFVGSIKTIEALREQEKEKRLNAQMKADLKDYTTNPTPQKLANLHLNYPSLKESLNAYTQTLSDADKRTTTEFATQAFGLNRANKTDQVLGLFDKYITAAETSGRPDMARVFRDAKNTYSQIEDPANREALIGSVLASTGKEGLDLYDKVYKSNLELTSFQKDLIAGGIDPKSKDGIEKSRQYVENKSDPWMETEVVNSSGKTVIFRGPKSVYIRTYGGSPASSNNAPNVGEIRGGYRYVGGDPSNKENWIKVADKVDQASPPSMTITESEAMKMRNSLGERAFMDWLRKNNIAIVGK